MTVSMGPDRSGIPWHIHKAGWNEVIGEVRRDHRRFPQRIIREMSFRNFQ